MPKDDDSGDASGLYDPSQPGSAPHAAPVDEIEYVTIYPEDGTLVETVTALLAAADRPDDVTVSDGTIIVPAKLAAKIDKPAKAPAKKAAAKSAASE